jgi:Mg2+/Co2+ transporter CorC
VFTQEVLEKMAPIINDYFRFKSLDEIEETESQFNQMMGDEEDDTNGFTDVSDADDIFG